MTLQGDSVSVLALVVSVIAIVVSVALAGWRLWSNRTVVARRATLDFVTESEIHSSEWILCAVAFKRWKTDGHIEQVIQPVTDGQRTEAIRILTLLNHFEFVAIAIERKIIDSETYRDWYGDAYVTYWQQATDLVRALREARGSNTLFSHFEQLARNWRSTTAE